MDNRDYKQNNDGLYDPWETDYYQTGSTRPPKNRRGLIALVLIGGIILGGVITCLGGVNSRIIRQWRETEAEDTLPMALHAAEPSETTVPMETAAPALTVSPGEAEVDLQPSPASVATHTQAGGLSLQEIAPIMGKSYAAVRQRIVRLRQTLKQRLEEQGYGRT